MNQRGYQIISKLLCNKQDSIALLLLSYGSQIHNPTYLCGFVCRDVDGLELRNQLQDFKK